MISISPLWPNLGTAALNSSQCRHICFNLVLLFILFRFYFSSQTCLLPESFAFTVFNTDTIKKGKKRHFNREIRIVFL